MMEFQLYMFNFDNTLFDTKSGLELCYQHAFETIGVDYEKEMLKEFMREPLAETFKRYDNDADSFALFEKTFHDASDSIIRDHATIFNDTLEVLKYLKENNKKMSIVTYHSPDVVSDVLKKYKMSEYFDFIIGHGDFSRTLPDPEALDVCIEKYSDVKRSDSVYIGDSRFDMEAAENAEIFSVFIDRYGEEKAENGSPDSYGVRITTLYALISGCRICSIATFAIHYDLLDPSINLDKIIDLFSTETKMRMNISERENNFVKVDIENEMHICIFPHGIMVKVCISDQEYNLDIEQILNSKDEFSSPFSDKCSVDLIINTLNTVIQRNYPKIKKDRISSHFFRERIDVKNITSYHIYSPMTKVFKDHFAGDVLHLLTKKAQRINDDLYTELNGRNVPYGLIDDSGLLAAVADSRVLLTHDGPDNDISEYLDLEAKIQNSWFLTHLMNSVVDNLANRDIDDMDMIGETLDTMYTNATFRYVVTSSSHQHNSEVAHVLYKASNLESISNDFRTKAELLNQKIELRAHISETQSSNMLNNILLALTIVSSVSAVFQILGYWSTNVPIFNYYSLIGSIIMIWVVLIIFFATRFTERKKTYPR